MYSQKVLVTLDRPIEVILMYGQARDGGAMQIMSWIVADPNRSPSSYEWICINREIQAGKYVAVEGPESMRVLDSYGTFDDYAVEEK